MKTIRSKYVNYTYPEEANKELVLLLEKIALKELRDNESFYKDSYTDEWQVTQLSEYLQNDHDVEEWLADEVSYVICEYRDKYHGEILWTK